MASKRITWGLAGLLASFATGCDEGASPVIEADSFELSLSAIGPITEQVYDGVSDDLLTAGLGKTGLVGPTPPFADPLNPTAAELRISAIYQNYRALQDTTAAGGFGTFYGPNLDFNGTPTTGEGKVSGREFTAFIDDGTGKKNVAVLLQLPDSFDLANPCLVAGASSGSRGIYGSIGTVGEWGLRHNCAVVYTDKGTGNGLHDLQGNTVNLLDGTRVSAVDAGVESSFTADLDAGELAAFNAATPNRVAFKHAHSQQNPEKDWGRDTLNAVRFAFRVLNEELGDPTAPGFARTFTPRNTLVIASSISNGGGAVLAAAELDVFGLIDGVVAEEPEIQVLGSNLIIKQGGRQMVQGKSLIDYVTFTNLFHQCASADPRGSTTGGLAGAALTLATIRCQALASKGLVSGSTLAEQASDALEKLHAYGWLPDTDPLHFFHVSASQAVAINFANAYGRFSVADNLCGFSIGATDPATGAPIALPAAVGAQSFGIAGGQAPVAGINFIYNNSLGAPVNAAFSLSPSTGLLDRALDGDLCIRAMATGIDPLSNQPLSGQAAQDSLRVRLGGLQTLKTANLRRKPTIILQGRADAITPINHTGRSFFGRNQLVEGAFSQARYYELPNTHHLDVLNAFPGLNNRYVPIQRYLIQSLDLMFAHLTTGAALPPSQVVRTVPRGVGANGVVPPLTLSNVPPIAANPPAADRITFSGKVLSIPD
jgi:hydroxybutyrate-dimer hydrolase